MRQKDPLRALSDDEVSVLRHLRRSSREPAVVVARAKALAAVAAGATYTAAAQAAGRHSGDAVGRLVTRFNQEGLEALVPRHGGGQPARYTTAERERILSEARRVPTPKPDGTATCSLTDAAAGAAPGAGWLAAGEHLHDLVRVARRRLELAAQPQLV
jgi:Winged helix-turn helix